MIWILFILLGIGLPVLGSIIGSIMLFNKYAQMKENSHELDLDENEFRKKTIGRYILIQGLFHTGPIYGLLIVILLWSYSIDLNIPEDIFLKFGLTVTIAIGVPGFFCNITRGMIARMGFEALVKEPEALGRVIVHSQILETPMIYGLLFALLSFSFSMLFTGDFVLTLSQVEGMLYAIMVFAALSSGVLLSGFLIKKVENPFSFSSLRKAVIYNGIGTFPAIIGLAYVIMKFVEVGESIVFSLFSGFTSEDSHIGQHLSFTAKAFQGRRT